MATYREQVLADGAIAYWRLNEPSGTSAASEIGGYTGTISGGVTLAQSGALADGNKAMAFNGTTGKIVTTGNVPLVPPLSIEAWTWAPAASVSTYFGSKFPNAAEDSISLQLTGVGLRVLHCFITYANALSPNSGHQTDTLRNLNDSQWHHIVWCFPGGTVLQVYLDGVVQSAPPNALNRPLVGAVAGPITLGYAPVFGSYASGGIDEVAIYPTALTPTQIAAHYTAASTIFRNWTAGWTHLSGKAS